MKQILPFLLLCALLSNFRSWGQASFNNPGQGPANAYDIDSKRIDDKSSPVIINQGAAQTKSYSIVLFKYPASTITGSVKLFYGTGVNNLSTTTALATTTLNSFSNWSSDPTTGYDRLSISGTISVSATAAGTNNAIYAVYYAGSSTTPTEISHPVYIQVQAASGGGSTPPPSSTYTVVPTGGYSYLYVEAGAFRGFLLYGTNLTATRSVTFNGQNLSFTVNSATNILVNDFAIPAKGDYSMTFTPSSGNPVTIEVHVVTPLAYFFPCSTGSNAVEICMNQCIAPYATPSRINGRVLAINSPEYDDYNNTYYWENNRSNSGQFSVSADGGTKEEEQVQWQYSPNQTDWYDIANATDRNYQPGALQVTTYYRRVSTHKEGSLGHRAYWYTSNVVAISVSASTPQATQSTYGTCGGGYSTLLF